jgi:hypothetical protein
VVVTGSTAWLKKQAQTAMANQNGYVNPQNGISQTATDEESDD